MLKFGNTFVNVGGTYLTGHTKYIPPADWREVFHTYSAGDSYCSYWTFEPSEICSTEINKCVSKL